MEGGGGGGGGCLAVVGGPGVPGCGPGDEAAVAAAYVVQSKVG